MSLSVIAVCTGNICRSPFAAEYLRQRAAELGLDWEVSSAGLYAMDGNPSTAEGIEAARQYGVDLSRHRAAMIQALHFTKPGLFLPMTARHKHELEQLSGGKGPMRTELLGAFRVGGAAPADIPDPIGGSVEDYMRCYELIRECTEGLLEAARRGKLG